ncbi:uncharacterized protein LODBEIA_P53590 [Lodderomyces beijingensis]|uniref:Uncharacterized protein n=1 Tax=Lodderomyces beijingensis TaxID=1775926 RepID=A0ABP0ZV64_9ASCO
MDKEYQPKSILDLPYPLISRILYERWRMDHSFQHILPMMKTCKELYLQHGMLYILQPLNIGASSICMLDEAVERIIQQQAASRIRAISFYSPTTHQSSKVSEFRNLTTVSVLANLNVLQRMLAFLPASVQHLSIILEVSRLVRFSKINIAPFNLKTLTFRSTSCLKRTRKLSFLDVINSLYAKADSDRGFYEMKSTARQVAVLLADLVYSNRKSLEYLDLKMISLIQVYFAMRDQGYKLSSIKFPQLEKIHVDQTTMYSVPFLTYWLKVSKELIYDNDYLAVKYVMKMDANGQLHVQKDVTKPSGGGGGGGEV